MDAEDNGVHPPVGPLASEDGWARYGWEDADASPGLTSNQAKRRHALLNTMNDTVPAPFQPLYLMSGRQYWQIMPLLPIYQTECACAGRPHPVSGWSAHWYSFFKEGVPVGLSGSTINKCLMWVSWVSELDHLASVNDAPQLLDQAWALARERNRQ